MLSLSTIITLAFANAVFSAPVKPDLVALVTNAIQGAFSFQGAPYGQQQGLTWDRECSTPWNATYIFKCIKIDGTVAFSTDRRGPVSNKNFQGPKIRVSPDGPNYCAQVNGRLAIERSRNNGPFVDITSKVKNLKANGAYNGQDAVFTDNFGMDCNAPASNNPPKQEYFDFLFSQLARPPSENATRTLTFP